MSCKSLRKERIVSSDIEMCFQACETPLSFDVAP